jgi:protein TonB
LITFGPLDFIRVGIHQRLDAVSASRPTAASQEVIGETAPKPPEDFSQPRPTAVPVPKTAQTKEPKDHAVQQPPSKAPIQPNETEPPPDGIPQQTESSPVSPSVQQTPGDPIGYVASNSRFLSIRRQAGSSSADSDPDSTVRIGQLIYSPQALYPEQALRLHVDGIVKLQAIIGEDGTIRTVTSASGPPILVAAATEAVREWRYEPTLIGKTPIESECEITFVFRQ